MPKTIGTEVFEYAELDESAKAKARDWYREGGFDYEWYGFEDKFEIAKRLGLDIEPVVKNDRHNGILFSGFWSQGDGACFMGRYNGTVDALAQVKGWAPQDAELLRIAKCLDEAQASVQHALKANITHRGLCYHEYTMVFDFSDDSEADSVPDELMQAAEEHITEALRSFARWIYRQLEDEYNYLNSDEAVAETIEANKYTFDSEGRRFG